MNDFIGDIEKRLDTVEGIGTVTSGEYKGYQAIVFGEDKDVFGENWYDLNNNFMIRKFSNRMKKMGIDAYKGKVYGCCLVAENVNLLFHEDEFDSIAWKGERDIEEISGAYGPHEHKKHYDEAPDIDFERLDEELDGYGYGD